MTDHRAAAPATESTPRNAPKPDQTDRAIVQAAREFLPSASPADLVIINDATGALTQAMLAEVSRGSQVVSWTSSFLQARWLCERFAPQIEEGKLRVPTGPEPFTLAQTCADLTPALVLGRLPKGLAELRTYASEVARVFAQQREQAPQPHAAALDGASTGAEAGSEGALILGGRVKHMTAGHTTALQGSFSHVRGARGVSKSRALVATGAVADVSDPLVASSTVTVPILGQPREITLCGIGGVFNGAHGDHGSALLLHALDDALQQRESGQDRESGQRLPNATAHPPTAPGQVRQIVDLGCGNGFMTAYAALAFPQARILASDDHAHAVLSTRATVRTNHLPTEQLRITWDHSLSHEASGSADLVLLNPPFHDGTTIDPTLVHGMLDAAARVLRPGGELWLVHNSHVRYRPLLEQRVGPVQQQARDRRFTVLSARRRAQA